MPGDEHTARGISAERRTGGGETQVARPAHQSLPKADHSCRRTSPPTPRPAVSGWPSQGRAARGGAASGPTSPAPPRTHLVAASVVALVNADNTIGEVAQRVQAVGPLLQGPESYILMVRNPGTKETVTHCTQGCWLPVCPAPNRCSEPSEGSQAVRQQGHPQVRRPNTGPAAP